MTDGREWASMKKKSTRWYFAERMRLSNLSPELDGTVVWYSIRPRFQRDEGRIKRGRCRPQRWPYSKLYAPLSMKTEQLHLHLHLGFCANPNYGTEPIRTWSFFFSQCRLRKLLQTQDLCCETSPPFGEVMKLKYEEEKNKKTDDSLRKVTWDTVPCSLQGP